MERRNLEHLNCELLDLKSCQIDMINLSIRLFSYVSIFIVAIFGFLFDFYYKNIKTIEKFSQDFNEFYFLLIIAIIFILSITPISFPLFMRIILHKSRSIFRILGYIRLVEELSLNNTPILPYEIAYAKLRCKKIFSDRIISDIGLGYYVFRKPFDILKEIFFSYKRVPLYREIPYKQLLNIYTGRYYKNKWFFLKILAALHLAIIVLLIVWLITLKLPSLKYKFLLGLILFFLFVWCLYNERLIGRYFFEIHYYPFSIHSWYCMFKLINENPTLSEAEFKQNYIECLTNRCT